MKKVLCKKSVTLGVKGSVKQYEAGTVYDEDANTKVSMQFFESIDNDTPDTNEHVNQEVAEPEPKKKKKQSK